MNEYNPKRATDKQKEAERERRQSYGYRFRIGDEDNGKWYTLAPVDDLDIGTQEELLDLPVQKQPMALLRMLADDETVDAVRALKGPAARAFMKDWQDWQVAESVSLPESEASST